MSCRVVRIPAVVEWGAQGLNLSPTAPRVRRDEEDKLVSILASRGPPACVYRDRLCVGCWRKRGLHPSLFSDSFSPVLHQFPHARRHAHRTHDEKGFVLGLREDLVLALREMVPSTDGLEAECLRRRTVSYRCPLLRGIFQRAVRMHHD